MVVEKGAILDALSKTNGIGTRAAKLLGIPLRTFRRYTKVLGIRGRLAPITATVKPPVCNNCAELRNKCDKIARVNQRLVLYAKANGFKFPPGELYNVVDL